MRWPWERVPWGRGRGANASDSAAGDADRPAPGSADPAAAERVPGRSGHDAGRLDAPPSAATQRRGQHGGRAAGRVPFLADHAPEPELPRSARAPGRSATVRPASSAGWPRRSAARSRTRVSTSSASPRGRHPRPHPPCSGGSPPSGRSPDGAAPRGCGRPDVQLRHDHGEHGRDPAPSSRRLGDRTRGQRAGGTRDPCAGAPRRGPLGGIALPIPSGRPDRRLAPPAVEETGSGQAATLGAGDTAVTAAGGSSPARDRGNGSGASSGPSTTPVDRSGPAVGKSVGSSPGSTACRGQVGDVSSPATLRPVASTPPTSRPRHATNRPIPGDPDPSPRPRPASWWWRGRQRNRRPSSPTSSPTEP